MISSLFVPIEILVRSDHPYRVILEMVDLKSFDSVLKGSVSERNSKYHFRMLVLQYMEDLFNREMARYLEENMGNQAIFWFNVRRRYPCKCYLLNGRNITVR